MVHRGICARRVPVELAFLYATLELRPTGVERVTAANDGVQWRHRAGTGRKLRLESGKGESQRHPGSTAVLEKAREELSEAFVKKGTNDHGIAYLVLYTVSRFAGGFLAASVIAIMLGVILGLNKVLFRAANPFIQIMKPISPLAWMPLLLYTVKDPKWTAVLVVFMAAIWPTLATTAFGVSSLRKEYLHVAAI